MESDFEPTRAAALDRLARFVPHAGRDYAALRNFDLGPGHHRHVSCLSPYLRCRLITEEEVIRAVMHEHKAAAAEKFLQEVFWRTYWKGWLELRPGIWDQYQASLRNAWNDVQTQGGLRDRWEAACRGETEIDCFNAWAGELTSTGYLHNHARMWFASIWIFTLRLPWELGADFFLRHLLDGDPASNTLGWRWVAGIQTPGKTYLARCSNIAKFTEGRFHPKWQLAGDAPALAAPLAPEPRSLPLPQPVDPNRRCGFLLHADDLAPGFALEGLTPAAYAVLAPQTAVGLLHSAPMVADFRSAAQKDAIARIAPKTSTITFVQSEKDILQWSRTQGLEQIVTAHAPVGPDAALLARLAQTPSAPQVHFLMRAYDRMAWPKATKGFFPFKKNIPDFLSGMDVQDTATG